MGIQLAYSGLDDIVEQVKKLGHKIEILSNIKSGKEATVYRVMLDDQMVAMKVYKNPEEINFKNTNEYLAGKFYKKLSERKAVAKNNKFAKKLKHKNWVKREFFMLEKLFDIGAMIPKPILQVENAIFMELLGDEYTVAPRLCDIRLSNDEAKKAQDLILKNIELFWNSGIVHADLSEYNILWWKNSPYIIDFPQSIDIRLHPNAKELFDRDLKAINKYFSKYQQ
jgi:RIO kinase 1